jgi:cytoskeletal protein CcmA (bactofilin family)
MVGNSTFSVIGSDVVITGNVSAKVDLHVDGRVEGDIACASLVQGESSIIHGAIVAETARLAGTVTGSVDARDLVITASAQVTGDVSYETITIEQGGHVDGQFRHKSKNGLAAASTLSSGNSAGDDRPALLLSN